MRLKNQIAVITGGAGAIGRATAKRFLNEGAKGILLVDLDSNKLKNVIKSFESDRIKYFTADVSKSEDVEKYIRKAIREFGKIDILFLNAGIEGVVQPLTEYPEDVYDKVMAVNTKSVWLGMKYAFPHMIKNGGGSIIISSSVAGLQGTPQVMAYVTSKHAVIGSMRVAALEGAPHNIRVNTIHPSPVDNRMMRSLEEGFAPGAAEEAKKGFEKTIPLGRYASNDEIADLVLFLASDESRFITGATYTIDGGLTV
ncbi:SDR family NAD(P)-dependent oxidoreductase [Rhodohalobacter sp. 614A]|uniref:SDR family NAD(P)-dependent oxidoreductase n=1 Tax=Rhodohalobacter sp. 614A TaxID=2908649 RepID=UPI001F315CD2|nr:glucose 1-dehydrogenase [Rhodohalobacter sp. 614A]